MDRAERQNDLNLALLNALEGHQAGLWTALPGIVQSFDPVEMTCEVQPTIQGYVFREEAWPSASRPGDVFPWATLPLLVNCPVVFQGGGGFTLTFPIKQGDEALVIFASRCIDNWWQLGDIQSQAEIRMHDLSDGFVIVGPRSLPKTLDGISTANAQLRSDDGTTFVEVAGDHVHVTAPAEITLHAPLVTIDAAQTTCTGKLTVEGLLTYQAGMSGSGGSGASLTGPFVQTGGALSSEGIVLNTHIHHDPQGGDVGPPI